MTRKRDHIVKYAKPGDLRVNDQYWSLGKPVPEELSTTIKIGDECMDSRSFYLYVNIVRMQLVVEISILSRNEDGKETLGFRKELFRIVDTDVHPTMMERNESFVDQNTYDELTEGLELIHSRTLVSDLEGYVTTAMRNADRKTLDSHVITSIVRPTLNSFA